MVLAESCSLVIATDLVLSVASHPASRRRGYSKFSAGLRSQLAEVFHLGGRRCFAAHDDARPVQLVPYNSELEWPVKDVLSIIERGFRGRQVLLTADCCHSGGLAEEAARQKGRISYGTLTSARSSATSTGSWAFTNCLIDLYQGKAVVDLDHDGVITFAEAAQYCDLQMAFKEDQRSTSATTGQFAQEFVFSRVNGPAAKRVLKGCEGLDKGKWYEAEILSAKDGKFFVTWPGWDSTNDSWLKPEQLRPSGRKLPAVGAKVQIQWGKKWYPGQVIRSELGLLLAHYEGFPAADDEWVPPGRLR